MAGIQTALKLISLRMLVILHRTVLLVMIVFPGKSVDAQTSKEIADGWSGFSGGKQGKVVFGRDNKIHVLDLTTGSSHEIGGFTIAASQYGPSASYKFSPDGKRIAAQNDRILVVMNVDGTKRQTIWQGSHPWDLIASGWDGNDAVVYSTFKQIVRTAINADNTTGTTTALYSKAPSGKGYASVERSSDWLCFIDLAANQPTAGFHRPIVYNLKTGVLSELLERNSDGCQLRLKPDGSGIALLCILTHKEAAVIRPNKSIIDKVQPPPGFTGNAGIWGMRWSNNLEYIIHNSGSNAQATSGFEGYIRKMSNKAYLHIGRVIVWPDLWVGDAVQLTTVSTPAIIAGAEVFSDSVAVTITCATQDATIRYTTDGNDPSLSSLVYSKSIVLKASAVVKAVAFKQGMTQSGIASRSFTKLTLHDPANPPATIPGIVRKYFEGTWTTLPDFGTMAPKWEDNVAGLDITRHDRADNFGLLFDGYISIPSDGLYTFSLKSDDASALFIGTARVVTNSYAQGVTSGSIGLKQGMHQFRVLYLEIGGAENLEVQYQFSTGAMQSVGGGILFRPDIGEKKSITVLAPVQGERLHSGQKVSISWVFNGGKDGMATASVSLDNGKSWADLFDHSYVHSGSETGSIDWTVPSGKEYLTAAARIKVCDYTNTAVYGISGTFAITTTSAAVLTPLGWSNINGSQCGYAQNGIQPNGRVFTLSSLGPNSSTQQARAPGVYLITDPSAAATGRRSIAKLNVR